MSLFKKDDEYTEKDFIDGQARAREEENTELKTYQHDGSAPAKAHRLDAVDENDLDVAIRKDPQGLFDRLLAKVTGDKRYRSNPLSSEMGFDRGKVRWSDSELQAAESADAIYELLKDGFDMSDITRALPHLLPLFMYLQSPNHYEYAGKFIDLGVMLKRDNDWLKAGFPQGLRPDDTQVENSDEQEAKDRRHGVE